jgi:hypothetical protein
MRAAWMVRRSPIALVFALTVPDLEATLINFLATDARTRGRPRRDER